jgi:hypothetical protein
MLVFGLHSGDGELGCCLRLGEELTIVTEIVGY